VQEVESGSQATPNEGGNILIECRQIDPPALTRNYESLVETILELREALKQRLRANTLYVAKTKIDEFLRLIDQLELNKDDFPSQPLIEKAGKSAEDPFSPTIGETGETAKVDHPPQPPIEPIKRGGGRYFGERGDQTSVTQQLNLQLIARFDANIWQILVEVAGEGLEHLEFTVGQGDDRIESLPRPQHTIFGPLRYLREPIQILCNGALHSEKRLDRLSFPVFFRVFQDDFAQQVANPSRGLNLAMVPANWKYDQEKSGPPPHEPEACSILGCVMHYFSAARSAVLAFDPPGQDAIELHVVKPRFCLEGSHISDANKKQGHLFVGVPPKLRSVNGGLAQVHTVVVGDEGRGTEKWRREYQLDGTDIAGWSLPDDMTNRGSGWYFIRLYDAKDELIDSLDFRYIPRLRAVNVSLPKCKQCTDDDCVSVDFVHESGVSVERLGSPSDSISSILGVQGKQDSYRTTKFEWPSNPDIREALFGICDGGKPVRVTFETDRIWWAVLDPSERNERVQWRSISIEVPVEAFAPESDAEMRIRFPRSAAMEASVGFEHTSRRNVGHVDAEGLVCFQLHEFCEAKELSTLGTHTLSLWVRDDGQEIQLILIKVTISKSCRWCDVRIASQKDLLDHVTGEHHNQLFERLELREEEIVGSALPYAVFICMECGQSYPKDLRPDHNATSLMLRHFDEVHPNSHPHFKRVDEPEALRNLFARQQKVIWKCRIENCDPVVPSSDDEYAIVDKKVHLEEEHLNQLFRGGL
jgi:hypothetical protein